MPYYIGDVIRDYNKLVVRTPGQFIESGVDVKTGTAVEGIDAEAGRVRLSDGTRLSYDILVMATGADALRLDIPGADREGVFVMRNLADALRLKSFLNDNECRSAVIIGGGYVALEMCEALKTLGLETTVMVRRDRPAVRWDAELTAMMIDELERQGVNFMPGTRPLSVEKGVDSRLRVITDQGELNADLVLMAVGVRNNSSLAQSIGCVLGESGAVKVDFYQRTSRDEVYAVGDCCEVFHRVAGRWVYLPLGDIANKQGRTAGRNIGGATAPFEGVVGAQSFRLFDLEAAATGLTENEAQTYGYRPVSTLIWGLPVGRSMSRGEKLGVKLVADAPTGKLLGAQAVGEKGAVARINSLSVALWSGLSLEEVGYLDLAYSPTFGGAWDAIHVAAQVLMRKLT
ncbi:MAG: FAD-dependent oxidoreductase [Syntrophales bacterium]|jgi:NADPH-dependent 2,4-dienoyl-CoA reductase/sulfur reductase-like enzyme|nr:FAD-dependent oxidoreductase [Syntrophales bacterium]MCK9528334.1 FAD-dependent oxidoreductase [Syntrophales bacterium]MDX9922173.1 FAD-dependent oxidoreductase [Syntrophales bacterium]